MNVISEGTVFEFRYCGKGIADKLKALENIPILKQGQVASCSHQVEVVESPLPHLFGEIVTISVWEHECKVLESAG